MEHDTNPFTDGTFQAAPKSLVAQRWEALMEMQEHGGYIEFLGSTAARDSQFAQLRQEGCRSVIPAYEARVVDFPKQRAEIPQASNF